MVWHKDLDEIGHSDVVAVGWLEPGMDFSKGAVDNKFVSSLAALLVNPWQPGTFMGRHACGFCRMTGGPAVVVIGGREVGIGNTNLFVPDASRVFAAPSTILHYIDAHDYAPPESFVKAVRACPEMKSVAYLKAIKPFVPHLAAVGGPHEAIKQRLKP